MLILAPALVGAGALGVCGCRCGTPGDTGPGAAPSASVGALPPELAAKVLAKVGDRTITLGDYAATLDRMDRFERVRYQTAERRQQLLKEMVEVELLAAEARRRGLDREPVVQSRIDQVLRELVLDELRAALPGPEAIPEAEVRAYYAAHRNDFAVPERRRLSVIVLATRAEADRVLSAARGAGPEAWGELVVRHSLRKDPPGAEAGGLKGDVGFVTVPGAEPADAGPQVAGAAPASAGFAPALTGAAPASAGSAGGGAGAPTQAEIDRALPEAVRRAGFAVAAQGKVHPEIVEAEGRFYVVRLVAKNAPGVRTYPEAERTIRVTLARQKIQQAEARLEQELRARYPITIDQAALAAVRPAASAAGGHEPLAPR